MQLAIVVQYASFYFFTTKAGGCKQLYKMKLWFRLYIASLPPKAAGGLSIAIRQPLSGVSFFRFACRMYLQFFTP
jgi:hypothetical protein